MTVIKEKAVGSKHYKVQGWKSIMPIPVAKGSAAWRHIS